MSVSPGLADLSRLYQTEFVRSARAVGVLWAVCTLCFAIIQVVILVQPSWVGTTYTRTQQAGPSLPSGTMGLFEVCLESDWPVPDCRGGLSSLSPLPCFQSVAVLVCVSLWAVWTSVFCLCLFRFCSAATVYKICAWLQLTAGFCLALACLLFPDSWESPEMRALCGDSLLSRKLLCPLGLHPGHPWSSGLCHLGHSGVRSGQQTGRAVAARHPGRDRRSADDRLSL
ncbi:LHFPL tetraspan subfamily member 3 protein isoform X2 [Cololabis saira]|uniref:LHFPL tetraspan subfamily member 3 protein isoform X2 n=1 Tax=Cololabis saira TaxID=129043 RepID=UPI002AD29283|nr:LHFPL tetraspan subfamily member 3 protein isoform X2 [Cololabis saira]